MLKEARSATNTPGHSWYYVNKISQDRINIQTNKQMYKIFTQKPGIAAGRIHKLLLVMKLTTLILIAAIMQVSAASYAQKITLKEKDASLENVFKEMRQQSGYDFFFDRSMLQKAKPVTIELKEVSLEEALRACLVGQPFTYSVEEKTIVIKEKDPTLLDKIKKALTPPTDIIGRVTNEQGQPLNGATITLKRTQTSTLSDANGNFTVRNVSPSDTLIVSYLGYKRAFIGIGNQTSLKVILQVATNNLDQVVIQAYGETSQRLTTGDIGKVTAEQIAKQPVMNVLDALQGQVPGVVVTSTSGYASGAVKVEIRGRNTINSNFPSDPLYIIDGVPLTILDLTGQSSYQSGGQGVIQSGIISPANGQSPFFSINPSDIESIEVLKDADATAIYGSRGSNGVILITTKKGKAGKTHADFNVYTGYSKVPGRYDLLNSAQYVAMREEALKNDGLKPDINNAPDIVAWNPQNYTDWQKYLFGGTGKYTDAEASVSGGEAGTTFRVAGGYHYQTEILTASGSNQRGNLSFNLNQKSQDQRFSMVLSGTYTLTSINTINVPGAITLPPDAPAIYDNKGNLNYAGWRPLSYLFPFGGLLQPYTSKTNLLNSNLVLNYQLVKGLILRTSFGYNNIQTNQSNLFPIASLDPASNPKGSATFGNSLVHNLIIEPQIEYNHLISKGKLNVLLGASAQDNHTSGIFLSGGGFTNDALLTSIGNTSQQYSKNTEAEYKYDAVFARINYNWEDKYILNINGRRDGSTKFGPGRQFGNFGSIGAAWIFSEENWIKNNIPLLSFGKIRGSYGITGSDEIGNYAYLSQYSFGTFTYNNSLPLIPTGHTDSTIHWQVNRKLEAAIDIGVWKDRLSLEVSWYRNQSNDQLVPFPTPTFTGFGNVTSNSPADVQNSGWEFVLNGKIVDNSNFKWAGKFNIGINRNKLLSYPNLAQSPYAGVLVVGESLNLKKVLHFTGVDPLTGQYTFEDKNHDGQITVDNSGKTKDDRYDIDTSPKFDGGFTNNITFKNWSLSVFFYFRKQLAPATYAVLDAAGDNTNQPVYVLNRWQKPGDITSVPKFTTNFVNSFYYHTNSDAEYENGSFIRLKNLSLSYTFPGNLLRKSGINNLRIFVQGENLFTITKYAGLDPEVPVFGALPNAKVLTIGTSINL